MILAVAGRRVDSPDSAQRSFPIHQVSLVKKRIRAFLQNQNATSVVCSAACGADLLVLSEAGSLGLRRRIVLPCARAIFRETSVTDRPGDWGQLYDSILDEVEARGDLITLDEPSTAEAYLDTSKMILDEAMRLAKRSGESVVALLIWDSVSRGCDDVTAVFCADAHKRGLTIAEIATI
jgi:hypothetical protein